MIYRKTIRAAASKAEEALRNSKGQLLRLIRGFGEHPRCVSCGGALACGDNCCARLAIAYLDNAQRLVGLIAAEATESTSSAPPPAPVDREALAEVIRAALTGSQWGALSDDYRSRIYAAADAVLRLAVTSKKKKEENAMTIDFNINDNVKFKLTPLGRQILARTSRLYEEDAEGYVTWQLWDLMHALGSYVFPGCDRPFETNVVLMNND